MIMNIPVGIRGTKDVGILISTQIAQERGATMEKGVLLPNQQAQMTAICVVALPGKFVILPMRQLVPLIDIQIETGQEQAAAEAPPADEPPAGDPDKIG